MLEILPAEAVAGICDHMNDDHADSIAAYARHFAALTDVVSARMLTIDIRGMDLEVESASATTIARITFDHDLTGADDARETLIAMARAATGAA